MKHSPANLRQDPPAWLEVLRLSSTDWRVSDSRLAASDPDRLLGYVERFLRDRYEVLWIGEPMRWAYQVSFEAALDAFVGGERSSESSTDERDRSAPPVRAWRPRRVHRRSRNVEPRGLHAA
jgi:hypothetical protein